MPKPFPISTPCSAPSRKRRCRTT